MKLGFSWVGRAVFQYGAIIQHNNQVQVQVYLENKLPNFGNMLCVFLTTIHFLPHIYIIFNKWLTTYDLHEDIRNARLK